MKFDPQALERARLQKGYSHASLARLADVTDRCIYNWEHGKREPQVNKLASVAKALDVTILEFMK